MATLHLVSGPIGAGKTTKAKEIALHTRAALMSPDEWMNNSGVPLRFSEVRALIEEAQFKVAEFLLSQDRDVVIEWGTWSRSERMEILSKIKSLGHSVYGYFLNPELSVLIKRVHSREADWAVADRVTRNEIIDSAQAYENPQSDEISLYDEIWFRD